MRSSLLLVFGIMLTLVASSQNAYEIKASIKPFNKGFYYLAYHFGNKQYLIDSAKVSPTGEAVFTGAKNYKAAFI